MLRLTRRELETGLWGIAPVLDPTLESVEVKSLCATYLHKIILALMGFVS